MRTRVSGLTMVGGVVSSVLAQPIGTWMGCPWDGTPSPINSVVRWDSDLDGPLPVRTFIATDAGIFVKGMDGQIVPFAIQGQRVTTMTTWNSDGDGPALDVLIIVLQDAPFESASVVAAVPQPDGSLAFAHFGALDSDVRGLTAYDTNGDGKSELVAVGSFDNIQFRGDTVPLMKSAAFDGENWSQLGTAPNSTCEVAKVIPCSPVDTPIPCEGNSSLVIGGFFSQAGGQDAAGIACWDDSAGDWAPCSTSTALSGTTVVRDVAIWDSDDGPQLIVAGFNVLIDGLPVGNIARFDGTDWLPFGDGVFGNIEVVGTFDVDTDGIEEPIIAAVFNEGGGSFPFQVAYWDGSQWLQLDGGELTTNNFLNVKGIMSFDPDGPGGSTADLLVVGSFDMIDTTPADNLAIWSPDHVTGGCDEADLAEPFGVHNFFDVSAFLALFIAENPDADLTGDGIFNFFDIQAYITAFVDGCP